MNKAEERKKARNARIADNEAERQAASSIRISTWAILVVAVALCVAAWLIFVLR